MRRSEISEGDVEWLSEFLFVIFAENITVERKSLSNALAARMILL